MRKVQMIALASSLSVPVMASDIGLTTTRLFTVISEEYSKRAEANFVFSPHSVLGVFHMAQLGASGDTKTEMDALVAPGEDFKLPTFDLTGEQLVKAETANRIYVYDFLESNEYLQHFDGQLRAAMGSDTKTIDFAQPDIAAAEINNFVNRKTHGHIKKLIDPSSLSHMTRMVLVNALYFKAPWRSQFKPENTADGVFHALTAKGLEQQRVKFMQQRLEYGFTFTQDSDMTAFSMMYSDHRLRMYVYMPTNLAEFESKIKEVPEAMEKLSERVKGAVLLDHELHLRFPKFKLAEESNLLDLVDVFRNLGARQMFDPTEADFSRITGSRDLFVSSYVHQADIEVDEEGTEATAATAMGVMLMSMPMPKTAIQVNVNKPFVFQVRFEDDGIEPSVLFAGRIADVKAAQ